MLFIKANSGYYLKSLQVILIKIDKQYRNQNRFRFFYYIAFADIQSYNINMIVHPIDPVYDEKSEVLILGSFPSVRSRKEGFFYGNPQNRFWRVLAAVFGEEEPKTVDEKKEFLLCHRIALYDVIKSCEIDGSADGSIRNAVPADIAALIEKTAINRIFLNGATAERYYKKYNAEIELPAIRLPSTSPANAAWTLEKLIEKWKIVNK